PGAALIGAGVAASRARTAGATRYARAARAAHVVGAPGRVRATVAAAAAASRSGGATGRRRADGGAIVLVRASLAFGSGFSARGGAAAIDDASGQLDAVDALQPLVAIGIARGLAIAAL